MKGIPILPKTERLSGVRRDDGERGIWQRRFWEHAIGDDVDYGTHMDYVHFNPVKPLDWIGSGVQDSISRRTRQKKTFVGIRLKAIPTYAS